MRLEYGDHGEPEEIPGVDYGKAPAGWDKAETSTEQTAAQVNALQLKEDLEAKRRETAEEIAIRVLRAALEQAAHDLNWVRDAQETLTAVQKEAGLCSMKIRTLLARLEMPV